MISTSSLSNERSETRNSRDGDLSRRKETGCPAGVSAPRILAALVCFASDGGSAYGAPLIRVLLSSLNSVTVILVQQLRVCADVEEELRRSRVRVVERISVKKNTGCEDIMEV